MRKILLLFMMLLFAISASSKDFKYYPKTKDELKELIENEAIYLGDIDTSAITDMSYLFIKQHKNTRDFSRETCTRQGMNCAKILVSIQGNLYVDTEKYCTTKKLNCWELLKLV